jgi:hypothetical protein
MGLVVRGTLEDGKIVFLWNQDEASPIRLEFREAKDGEEPGFDHMALLVDDMERAFAEGKASGVDFASDPFYVNDTGRMVAKIHGPEGTKLQIAKKVGRGDLEDFR